MTSIPEYPVKPEQQTEMSDVSDTTPIVAQPVAQPPAVPQIVMSMPAPGYVNPGYVRPVPLSQWSSGICDCFDDMESTIEMTFCHYCQFSRQYNQITYGSNKLEPWSCVGPFIANVVIGAHVGSFGIAWYVRNKLRQRYQIVGDDMDDCIKTFFCTPCVGCQNYREMSLRGEWTSGACIEQPYQLNPAPAVMGQAAPVQAAPIQQA